jgi:hypothetical protein
VLAGLDSKREQTPLKTSHKFLSGSVGKTDVTASAQRWIQAGKLKLEDKAATGVARYAFISGADGKKLWSKTDCPEMVSASASLGTRTRMGMTT